uniref:Uncharacterized protein n=1 Tax=Arundo donax TaxID=35708 RepID=A0A0A9A182_ARUDO
MQKDKVSYIHRVNMHLIFLCIPIKNKAQ